MRIKWFDNAKSLSAATNRRTPTNLEEIQDTWYGTGGSGMCQRGTSILNIRTLGDAPYILYLLML